MLHPLEVLNIRKAIEFYQNQDAKTVEDLSEFVCRPTVLVDIFARDEKTGAIKIDASTGTPEVHTVVLYFQQDKIE